MLTFNGHKLQFCSYSDIEKEKPIWVAQTRMDNRGRSLNIWKVNEQYYVTIG